MYVMKEYDIIYLKHGRDAVVSKKVFLAEKGSPHGLF